MTKLEMERAWDDAAAYDAGSESEGEEEEGDVNGGERFVQMRGELPDVDVNAEAEDIDFDLLCADLVTASPVEAEAELRQALRRARKEISEANVVGLLFKVFRLIRDVALESQEFDGALLYCDHLTDMCDRNFSLAITGEADVSESGQPRGNFPATVVAAVYAEAGRTFSLAGALPKAQSLLEKTLYVYGMVPSDDAVLVRIRASIKASLARVLKRRKGHSEAAQEAFLETLDMYSQLPAAEDTSEFVLEYIDFLGDDGGDQFSSVTFELLDDLMAEKFGEGSDQHLATLKKIGDMCTQADQPELGGPALAKRARILRERADGTCSMAKQSAADAAELQAAVALEATLPTCLEKGDLRGAAEAWEEALQFRESLEGPDSPLCVEMRTSLAALQQAILASGAQQAEPSKESLGAATDDANDEVEDTVVPETWDA